jgi:hypothetical protein
MLGEIGHIRSGSERGPRYDPQFSAENLSHPNNGIFLCRHHHKIIDSCDSEYSVSELVRMKDRHEYQVGSKLLGLSVTSAWIESIQIDQFRRFQPNMKLDFGRINHIFGNNGVGKSVSLQLLSSALTAIPNRRFEGFEINLHVAYSRLDHRKQTASVRLHDTIIVREHPLMLFPEPFAVVHLSHEFVQGPDDIESIRECFDFSSGLVERIVSVSSFKGITTSNYSIRISESDGSRELLVDPGYGEVQAFATCSGSETARVVLDIGISAAVEMCRYRQVILIIDWPNTGFLKESDLAPYMDYLHSHRAHFQTFFVSPTQMKGLSWTGWQEICLEESSGVTRVRRMS